MRAPGIACAACSYEPVVRLKKVERYGTGHVKGNRSGYHRHYLCPRCGHTGRTRKFVFKQWPVVDDERRGFLVTDGPSSVRFLDVGGARSESKLLSIENTLRGRGAISVVRVNLVAKEVPDAGDE